MLEDYSQLERLRAHRPSSTRGLYSLLSDSGLVPRLHGFTRRLHRSPLFSLGQPESPRQFVGRRLRSAAYTSFFLIQRQHRRTCVNRCELRGDETFAPHQQASTTDVALLLPLRQWRQRPKPSVHFLVQLDDDPLVVAAMLSIRSLEFVSPGYTTPRCAVSKTNLALSCTASMQPIQHAYPRPKRV